MTFWFYPIDWDVTASWMQAWAGFAGAGAVAWAAYRGGNSFENWLSQRQYERMLDVGEEVLTLAYRAEDVFRSIRNPFHPSSEIDRASEILKKRQDYPTLSPAEKTALQTAQVILDRIAAQNDYWTRLAERLPQSRIYFGADVEEAIRSCLIARNTIASSAQMYAHPVVSKNPQVMQKIEAAIWGGYAAATDAKDEVEEGVKKFIATAQAEIEPVLSIYGKLIREKSKRGITGPRDIV